MVTKLVAMVIKKYQKLIYNIISYAHLKNIKWVSKTIHFYKSPKCAWWNMRSQEKIYAKYLAVWLLKKYLSS